jgi:predicted molibdopterin-dependent oxidoreductase YjgC
MQGNQSIPSLAREHTKIINLTVNGEPVNTNSGQTVAAVLVAAGIQSYRHTFKSHQPRGLYCGMGICYECLVTINDQPGVRACVTLVEDGMRIETAAKDRHD